MLLHGPSPMQVAIDSAWEFQGLTFPNPAVGCSVVDANGVIVSVGVHEKAGEPHAEVHALQMAYSVLTDDTAVLALSESSAIHDFLIRNHNGIFTDCTLYVTLEPCVHHGKTPSCALLINSLGIKKVVVAQHDPNAEAAGGIEILKSSGCEVTIADECAQRSYDLLKPFMTWQKKSYVTFKWAQRLDGTVDGGTISSHTSRVHVHAMRDVSDLIVIGGETVRADRPTLDARLVDGKVCDVLVYSRQKTFDRSIPLFNVEGRNVYVDSSLDRINGYRNILIEGGPAMFEATKKIVDSYLCFVAPKSGGTIRFTNTKDDFRILHSQTSGNDMLMWMELNKT
ncbi:MAG: bifunctional diaminohydroxyphosphoribosylaminopyrimidine deaminase/5-amino-6-(5-phosphoribosylamino)uracil reductase RibD [Helicobacteraceae bacterium]|jgi:diaminohydroxyphosphoribosylaminopyrimidine deaminase/5-amino-6-(5-phosphoribosylamino)uracil reductase|nr:bifunctional diaminohydroxyphosphoribosylaminopyrimidine deaminase/5-amino-6-(5-phosphoribosylamino)uracil reductase RibD [Helicobacteraceae bacterium]